MQKDFHFDVIYCLCRCAGFAPAESRTVAASSQYTDDCTVMELFRKPGGAMCSPLQTYPGGLSVLDGAVQDCVLRPFHFTAAAADCGVVLPGNPAVTELAAKAAALAASKAPYGLHALGLALHALVDSFAHQGFSAFWSPSNAVAGLELAPPNEELLDSIRGFFLSKFPDFPIHLGHAQAGYCPDVPFLKWSYKQPPASAWTKSGCAGIRFKDGRVMRDNAVIASAAVRAAAAALAGVAGLKPARDAEEQTKFFAPALFRRMDLLRKRSEQWWRLFFADKFFDFRNTNDGRCFNYEGKEWLGKAIRPPGRSDAAPVRVLAKGYTKTDWWKFQQAAGWCGRQLGVNA